MNAATLSHEIDAERETPAPALIPMRTQEEPHAAGGPPRADDASRSELWRIHGTVPMRFAFKLTLGDKYRAGDIVQETRLRAWRHPEVAGGHAGTIKPWLFTVARHSATDPWRTKSRHDDVLDSSRST